MKRLEPRVSKKEALWHFEGPRWSNLWGFFGPKGFVSRLFSVVADGKTSKLQLIWMPYYLISFGVSSPRGPGRIAVSVEGYSGAFAVFQMEEDLVEREIEGEFFPPSLSEPEAVEIGREELLKTILRRRGNREKPVVLDALGVSVFYYPYWVYYYVRHRRYLDFRIYDAARGEKGGARTKVGILEAFVAHTPVREN